MTAKITVMGADDSPTLNNGRTPTIDELRRFLVAFSAVRREVLGNYR